MGKELHEFATQKIKKLLLKIAIPILISYLVGELYSVVDMFFVGNYSSSDALGSMVLVFPIQTIVFAISAMIATGTSTAFSQKLGSRDLQMAREYFNNGLSMTLLVLVPIGLFCFFNPHIVLNQKASIEIRNLATEYLNYVSIGMIFLGVNTFLSQVLLTMGYARVGLISTCIGTVINIILDFLLVKIAGYGISGAGFATLSSLVISCAFTVVVFLKYIKNLKFKLTFEINKSCFVTIILLGISTFIVEAEDGILMSVLSGLLVHAGGEEALSVLSLASKVYMFSFITVCAIAASMQPIVSYCVGAGMKERVFKTKKETKRFSLICTGIVWALMLIFAEVIIGLFVKDQAIISETAKSYRIMTAAFPVLSIYYVNIYFFQATGNGKISVFIAVLRQLVLMIPISILLVKTFNLGAMGVWIAYPICDVLATFISDAVAKRFESEKISELQLQN